MWNSSVGNPSFTYFFFFFWGTFWYFLFVRKGMGGKIYRVTKPPGNGPALYSGLYKVRVPKTAFIMHKRSKEKKLNKIQKEKRSL